MRFSQGCYQRQKSSRTLNYIVRQVYSPCDLHRACSCKGACLMGIQYVDFAEWRPKQCSILFAIVRRWLVSAIMSLGGCRTKRHKHSLNKGPLPLYMRRRAIEAVLNEILGSHNKPKAVVHKLTGPKKKKKYIPHVLKGHSAFTFKTEHHILQDSRLQISHT